MQEHFRAEEASESSLRSWIKILSRGLGTAAVLVTRLGCKAVRLVSFPSASSCQAGLRLLVKQCLFKL